MGLWAPFLSFFWMVLPMCDQRLTVMVTTMSTAFLGLQMALSILWQRSIAWHRDEIVLTMRSKGPKPAMTGNGFFLHLFMVMIGGWFTINLVILVMLMIGGWFILVYGIVGKPHCRLSVHLEIARIAMFYCHLTSTCLVPESKSNGSLETR